LRKSGAAAIIAGLPALRDELRRRGLV